MEIKFRCRTTQSNNFHYLFIGILHIENLSIFSTSSLTSLKLQINQIDKICNLDALVNLIELDLSHNLISRIENLQVIS